MARLKAMKGVIYGIGVGPGDPELLTIKAARLIQEADFIAYPAPERGDSFARSIAAGFIPDGREEMTIRMNIGDGSFPKDDIYDQAAERLIKEARLGKKCVVLCEGDPLFFGSFYYLFSRLVSKAQVEVVPGVSSLMACAAVSGRPLTYGSYPLSVLPATLPYEEFHEKLKQAGCAAIVKLGRHLPKVRKAIEALRLQDQAYYIEYATLPNAKAVKLDQMMREQAPYFSMILVGQK